MMFFLTRILRSTRGYDLNFCLFRVETPAFWNKYFFTSYLLLISEYQLNLTHFKWARLDLSLIDHLVREDGINTVVSDLSRKRITKKKQLKNIKDHWMSARSHATENLYRAPQRYRSYRHKRDNTFSIRDKELLKAFICPDAAFDVNKVIKAIRFCQLILF